MKGYKYICDYFDYENYEIYLKKAENNELLLYNELNAAKGYYDSENLSGIYFCKSQKDLVQWIGEILKWEDAIGKIDVLEIAAVGEIKERIYNDGRKAYVTNKAYLRVLDISEISKEINQLCDNYFKC